METVELTPLETNLVIEIRRVHALGKTFPSGSLGRKQCEDEVQRSLEALAEGNITKMDERWFHLTRTIRNSPEVVPSSLNPGSLRPHKVDQPA